jgi:hypothetical protein
MLPPVVFVYLCARTIYMLKSNDLFHFRGEESTTETATTALATRTPRAVQRVAQRIPLPPSPQVVTEMIVRGQQSVSNRLTEVWEKSGTTELIEQAREVSSTVVGVHIAVLLLEAWGLQRVTFPWTHAFDIPATPALRLNSPTAVSLPDVFVLVKPAFWQLSTVWLSTSLFVPLLFAYFFNFTHAAKPRTRAAAAAQHAVDPLTFNVIKALVTWLVYSQGFSAGLFDSNTVESVNTAFPGGYTGVLIGAGIGGLVSLYDAILQKH